VWAPEELWLPCPRPEAIFTTFRTEGEAGGTAVILTRLTFAGVIRCIDASPASYGKFWFSWAAALAYE
jgi:hypothetical protein